MKNKSFNKEELKKKLEAYPTFETWYGIPHAQIPKYSSPVTPKENFKLFTSRQDSYWIPSALGDINYIYPNINPDAVASGYEGGIDSYGVKWIPCSNPMLPALVDPGKPLLRNIEDWKQLKVSDIDSWNWEASAKIYSGLDRDRMTMGVVLSGFFERLISLMDFMYAAMALVEEPEEVASFMDSVADYNIKLLEHYKEYYDVDAVIVHDDWGSQRAPFFSKGTLRETIMPAYKKFTTRAKELDVFVLAHCCGQSEGFVDELMEIGVDAWQPQLDANPNIEQTIEKYKDKFLFDILAVVPANLTDEQFRDESIKLYKKYTKHMNVTFGICDETYILTEAQSDILYEIARKAATGEL